MASDETRARPVVRRERPEDEPTVDALVRAAFEGPHVADLLIDMRRDHCWLGLSFVAEQQASPTGTTEVAGHVSCTRGWVDGPERLVEVLVLSPLSVRPDLQRRGVGRALLAGCLEALASRPEPLVFLEGDPAYYRRSGFTAASAWGFERPSVRIPDAAFQARRLPSYDEGLTGRLVYPDVFWRHDAVGLRP